ncbi:PKD domain-containing protein [Agromyces sp. NPDC055520]
MVRRRLLLSAAATAVVALLWSTNALGAAANEIDIVSGQNVDGATRLDGSRDGTAPATEPSAEDEEGPEEDTAQEEADRALNLIEVALGDDRDACSPTNPNRCFVTEPDPAAPIPGTIITLRDIASFVPAKPAGDMEPRGWAVRDLPANFIADASTQIITGTLLGQPADVRFTPVGYRWTHSDGGIIESATPGTTWESLGLREFTATATSHQYDESGHYTVTLDIVLRAEYRFAGSAWRPIAGTLTITGDPQPVLVGQIDTVLVDSDCIQNPTGPGC